MFFLSPAPKLRIRLSGEGSSESAGRVEVSINDIGYGTICDDSWNLASADVACRMLGFPFAVEATTNANTFGEGYGRIAFNGMECLGNESSLLECSHYDWEEHDCTHSEDVGVRCFSKLN